MKDTAMSGMDATAEEWIRRLCAEVENELREGGRFDDQKPDVASMVHEPELLERANISKGPVLVSKLFAARVLHELSSGTLRTHVRRVGVAVNGSVVDVLFFLKGSSNTTRIRKRIYDLLARALREPLFESVQFDFLVASDDTYKVPEGYENISIAGV
jgi:hypothetical protein